MKALLLVASILISVPDCHGQFLEDEDLLLNMMSREPLQFQYFIENRDSLEIQIIYTQINRDANNRPVFTSFYFNVDPGRYFYPASTVKLPVVLLSLEKLNKLHVPGLTKFTAMLNDSVYSGQEVAKEDTTSENGLPSIAHYAKKILIASDNDAYNRLYEFLGQRAANELLMQKGYTIRLLHRLDRSLTPDENRHTEAIRFVRNDTVVYYQAMLTNDSIAVDGKVMKGVGHIRNDTLIRGPFDFSYKNFFPLTEQQFLLRSLLFPETVPPMRRFRITPEDRNLVLRYMSQLPGETRHPAYAADTSFYPAFGKFLMFGESRDPIPGSIRIFNKVGDAYGYLIDNAYIVDFDRGIEFFLSAVIHANTDGIYNDGEYEYKTLGYPFMKDLGQLIYQYELRRNRWTRPDLSEFKLQYEELKDSN